MSPKIYYEKDNEKKEVEKSHDVKYDFDCKGQRYTNVEVDKDLQHRCHVKYVTNDTGVTSEHSAKSLKSSSCKRSKHGSSSKHSSNPKHGFSDDAAPCRRPTPSTTASKKSCSRRDSIKKLSPTEVAAKCYEVKQQKNFDTCHSVKWQHGKYVRDECGSGIVPLRFDFKPNKRLWCKTPLSMYQATIGELGKQLLCREKIIARDVKPGPPCNICECSLPPCRGYYRKYDCMRPCEEEHAIVRRGEKVYRDRIQRYWEPCLTEEQKYTLNVNEYGPQNAALAIKLKRETMDIPCW